MLKDNALDFRGNMFLLCHQHTVPRMTDQDGGGNIRIRMLMRIVSVLVFLEIHRPFQLADIMIIGSGARQERICLDAGRRRFSKIRYDD